MYGLETSTNHLNDTSINWGGLNDPANFPSFAGRYFISAPSTYAHSEGANSPYGASLVAIVPIQGGDTIVQRSTGAGANTGRQATMGRDGFSFGYTDGSALCRRLESCLITGELSVPTTASGILVFLEVQTGTLITIDYWAGWTTALVNYVCVAPSLSLPFRPCIICDFVPTPGGGSYHLDPNVKACLDGVAATYTRSPTFCHAFWARTPVAGNVALFPPPPFPQFEPYSQPLGGTSVAVNVALWRYAPPPFVQVLNPADVGLSAMSDLIAPSDLLQINANFDLANTTRVTVGVDCDSVVSSATAATLAGAQTALADAQGLLVSFVGRYLAPHKNQLTSNENQTLTGAGLKILSINQRKRRVNAIDPNINIGIDDATPAADRLAYMQTQGVGDGTDAFNTAFALNQEAHTTIYFGIDYDYANTAAEQQALQKYFTDIRSAYIAYLNAQAPGAERRPFAIGVYGTNLSLDFCYQHGLANYFWKAAANYGRPANQRLYASANLWQEGLTPQQIGSPPPRDFDVDVAWKDEGSWEWRNQDPVYFPPIGYVGPP